MSYKRPITFRESILIQGFSIGLCVIFLGDKQSYEMNNQIARGVCSRVNGAGYKGEQLYLKCRDSFLVNQNPGQGPTGARFLCCYCQRVFLFPLGGRCSWKCKTNQEFLGLCEDLLFTDKLTGYCPLADIKGRRPRRVPPSQDPTFSQFHAFFRNFGNIVYLRPLLEGWRPLLRKSWILLSIIYLS